MKIKIILSVAIVVTMIGAAYAENAAIQERKSIFSSWGKATKPIGGALRGNAPFDLTATQAALKLYIDGSKKLVTLFPDDSKTGDKTEAMPAIWDDKPKFISGFTKMEADATAALAAVTDEASFKTEMPKVLGNCGSCHKAYKKPD